MPNNGKKWWAFLIVPVVLLIAYLVNTHFMAEANKADIEDLHPKVEENCINMARVETRLENIEKGIDELKDLIRNGG